MRRVLLIPLLAGLLAGCKTVTLDDITNSFDEIKEKIFASSEGAGKALAELSDQDVCNFALTSPTRPLGWDRGAKWEGHVKEALHRGLDVETCVTLTGRRTTVAAAPVPTVSPPAVAGVPEASPPRPSVPRPLVMAVQRSLVDLGIDPGPIDGLVGRKTRTAVRTYQKRAELEVTGKVTRTLLENLQRDVTSAIAESATDPIPLAAVETPTDIENVSEPAADEPEDTEEETAAPAEILEISMAPAAGRIEPASPSEPAQSSDEPGDEEAAPVAADEPAADELAADATDKEPASEGGSLSVATLAEPSARAPIKREFFGIDLGRYHALIIGNNEYDHLTDLTTPRNDALALAKLLRREYGFTVNVLLDAKRHDILSGLAGMRRRLGGDDNLLIYYAGHGYFDRDAAQGYWLPVDAEEDIKSNWISNADVTDVLRATDAHHVLVMADSCYSGALVRSGVPLIHWTGQRKSVLKRLAFKRSRKVMTSGGLEPVIDGGGGGHSVFAHALLDILAENSEMMAAFRVFAALREKVVDNADQTPEYSHIRKAGHDGGEFIFIRNK